MLLPTISTAKGKMANKHNFFRKKGGLDTLPKQKDGLCWFSLGFGRFFLFI